MNPDHWSMWTGCFSNTSYCRNPDYTQYDFSWTCKKCVWWATFAPEITGKERKRVAPNNKAIPPTPEIKHRPAPKMKYCVVTWWAWFFFYMGIALLLVFVALVVMAVMKFLDIRKRQKKYEKARA